MKLKMVIPGDSGPSVMEATPLFTLHQIKTDQACVFLKMFIVQAIY